MVMSVAATAGQITGWGNPAETIKLLNDNRPKGD